MQQQVDVFLLAAGESSRMFPLSQIMEKSLLPVDGKPVIRHIVDNLRIYPQIRQINVCCLDKFLKQFEHEFRDVCLQIKGFEYPMGTFRTWRQAIEKNTSEWSMIHYADCLTEINYADFISKIDPKYDGLIAVTNSVRHDYSEVAFTVDGVVQDFVEKPKVINYSWSGIGLFKTKELAKTFNGTTDLDWALNIFPKMIEKATLRGYPYNGFWYDMGNLNSYRKVCSLYDGSNGDVKL